MRNIFQNRKQQIYVDPDKWELERPPENLDIEHNWENASFDNNIWIKQIYSNIYKIGIKVESSPGHPHDIININEAKEYKEAKRKIVPHWMYSKKRKYSFFTTMVNTDYLDQFEPNGYMHYYVLKCYPKYAKSSPKERKMMEICAYLNGSGEKNEKMKKTGEKMVLERENAFQMDNRVINEFIKDYISVY